MKFFGRDFPGFAGLLVFFVMLLLISGGLCGLQTVVYAITNNAVSGNVLEGIFMFTGVVELLAMAVAAGGIVLVTIAWVIFSIFRIPFPEPRRENLSILQSSDDKEKSDKDSQ